MLSLGVLRGIKAMVDFILVMVVPSMAFLFLLGSGFCVMWMAQALARSWNVDFEWFD